MDGGVDVNVRLGRTVGAKVLKALLLLLLLILQSGRLTSRDAIAAENRPVAAGGG